MEELENKLSGIQKNVPLANYTSFKIGGPAEYFFTAKNKEELINALKLAKRIRLPVYILGGGSNALVSDKGFDGLVIKIGISDIKIEGNKVSVGAGENLAATTCATAEAGLSGLEWAAGVPGTIGGAICGNAQAFSRRTSDLVKSVEALDIKTFKIKNFKREECRFSLKNSIFNRNRNLIIISAQLAFKKKDPQKVKNQIKEYLEYRRKNHPIRFPSAGSVFVNPETIVKNQGLLEEFPELREYNRNGVIPSGYLIAKSGLAGKTMGRAQISEKHANFIINLGRAKAEDVLALIKLAKKEVKKTFGIKLETEIQLIGF